MMKVAPVSFALALALTACGPDRAVDDGDDDIMEEPQPPPPVPRTLDLVGTYRLHSTFDIATSPRRRSTT